MNYGPTGQLTVEACREQARIATEQATDATTEEAKVGFLTAAMEWLRLAEEIEECGDQSIASGL